MNRLPEWIWAPAAAATLTAILGVTGIWAGMPWLFPSLGPTIFLQVHKPDLASAHPWNTMIGHGSGIFAGVVGVVLLGAQNAPPVLSADALTWPRLWAAVVAMALTLLVQIPLKASHPPAAATALLVALGGFALTLHDMTVLAAGILLVAAVGEGARRLRLRPGQ